MGIFNDFIGKPDPKWNFRSGFSILRQAPRKTHSKISSILATMKLRKHILRLFVLLALASSIEASETQTQWSELHYNASKFFMEMKTSVYQQRVSGQQRDRELIEIPQQQALKPNTPSTLKIRLRNSILGRHTESTVWLQNDLRLLQRESIKSGKSHRYLVLRYGPNNALAISLKPANRVEAKRGRSTWTKKSIRNYQLPVPVPPQATESEALFYIPQMAQLLRPGTSRQLTIFDRNRLVDLHFRIEETTQLYVNFDELNNGNKRTIRSAIPVLRATVSPINNSGESLDLLGYDGTVTLYIDPSRGAIVRIVGMMDMIGEITVNLKKIVLDGSDH